MSDRNVEVTTARKHLGLTQAQLAERAGVSERTVRNMEAGETMSPASVSLVYQALGMETARPVWPPDVDVFLQMVGFRLSSLDEEERMSLISDITQMLVYR